MKRTKPRNQTKPIQTGTVTAVEDHGTIIIVQLRTGQGWLTPVFFDHRQFAHMLEAESCSAGELVGREAIFDGEHLLFVE